ncbi:leucine rich repeat protein, partial [Spraguea lophii 42_110]
EKNITTVLLYRNRISKIELPFNADIEYLDLGDNSIREIECLENVPNLKTLDLTYNCITEIKNLNLKYLEELYLIANDIEKMSGLENLKNLKKLDLGCNEIEEIEGLDNLYLLEELYLGSNSIEKIENVKHMKLKIFAAQDNLLEEVDCRELPKTLKELYLSENENLKEIKNLELLKDLEYLEIVKCKITEKDINLEILNKQLEIVDKNN